MKNKDFKVIVVAENCKVICFFHYKFSWIDDEQVEEAVKDIFPGVERSQLKVVPIGSRFINVVLKTGN
jgi:hypothetical protein